MLEFFKSLALFEEFICEHPALCHGKSQSQALKHGISGYQKRPQNLVKELCLRSTPHPGCQSPPGLWNIFSRESQPKPSFATVTGWGVDPRYANIMPAKSTNVGVNHSENRHDNKHNTSFQDFPKVKTQQVSSVSLSLPSTLPKRKHVTTKDILGIPEFHFPPQQKRTRPKDARVIFARKKTHASLKVLGGSSQLVSG